MVNVNVVVASMLLLLLLLLLFLLVSLFLLLLLLFVLCFCHGFVLFNLFVVGVAQITTRWSVSRSQSQPINLL